MAVTITAGTNSYLEVADADIYFNDRLFSDAWTAASADQKAQALIMATKKLDRQQLRGMKADPAQGLEFPRRLYSDSVTPNPWYDPLKGMIKLLPGWIVESEVAQSVKDAVCEEAITLIQIGKDAQARAQFQAQGVKSFSLGNLSETFGMGASGQRLLSAEAKQLLAPYLAGGAAIV